MLRCINQARRKDLFRPDLCRLDNYISIRTALKVAVSSLLSVRLTATPDPTQLFFIATIAHLHTTHGTHLCVCDCQFVLLFL